MDDTFSVTPCGRTDDSRVAPRDTVVDDDGDANAAEAAIPLVTMTTTMMIMIKTGPDHSGKVTAHSPTEPEAVSDTHRQMRRDRELYYPANTA